MATQFRRRMVPPRRPQRTIRERLVGLGFLAFGALTVVMGLRGRSAIPLSTNYGLPPSVMKVNGTACVSEMAMLQAQTAAVDPPTLAKLISDPRSGCTVLDSGTPVQIDEVKGGLQRFHIRGSPDSLWAPIGVIK